MSGPLQNSQVPGTADDYSACGAAKSLTLNEQAVLQLKHRGLRDASLWLGDGGFALRQGDIVDLAVHPESRRRGVGTALSAPGGVRSVTPASPFGRPRTHTRL